MNGILLAAGLPALLAGLWILAEIGVRRAKRRDARHAQRLRRSQPPAVVPRPRQPGADLNRPDERPEERHDPQPVS